MNEKSRARYEAQAKIIKAMAHPSRLLIVDVLAKGERCVCEFQGMIGADMSTVSKHLSVLKNAGIIGDRRSGTNIYYYLRVPCVMNFLGCVEEVMQSNLKSQNEAVRACRVRR